MDEDLEMEDQNAETELPVDAMDLSALSAGNPLLAAYMKKYEADIASEAAAREKQARTRQQMFEAGEKEILARRYGAPTTRDKLFALSAALASPRYYGGLAGTMSRVAPVLGEMSSLQSKAESQRSEALDQLRREYLTGNADATVAAAQAQREARARMLSPIVSATKQPDPFKGAVWDAEEGRWVMRPGTIGGPPVLTPEQAAQFAQDPKNKGMKFYTTDGRLLEIK